MVRICVLPGHSEASDSGSLLLVLIASLVCDRYLGVCVSEVATLLVRNALHNC